MSIISIQQEGNFDNTNKFLKASKEFNDSIAYQEILKIAERGVSALSAATPVNTGTTAASWGYEIEQGKGKTTVVWTNDNVVNGVNIAIILQYGHGTRNGGYVVGRDYINPALTPIFDQMTDDMWKAVIA